MSMAPFQGSMRSLSYLPSEATVAVGVVKGAKTSESPGREGTGVALIRSNFAPHESEVCKLPRILDSATTLEGTLGRSLSASRVNLHS